MASDTDAEASKQEAPKQDAAKQDAAKRDAEGRMAFTEHIRELRDRLRNSVIALVIGFVATFNYSEEIFVILAKPLLDAWAELGPDNPALGKSSFYFTGLVDPFWTFFSMAFYAGLFLSMPVIFYQLWKFIAPGLYKNERRWGVVFAIVSALLFTGGAVFCYLIVLPAVCEFLLNYANNKMSVSGVEVSLSPLLGMREYLDFAKKLLIGFGLIFELPLIIFVMSLAGMVTHRSLWKFNRWAILLAFVIAAILTPPDIYSQMLMAGPLVVLYNLSIILSLFVTLTRERRERKRDQA